MSADTARPRWHYGVPVLINFSSVLLSFLSRIILARLIGPAPFGLFAVWQNNVQLFGTLGTFGQQNYVLRELAHAAHPQSHEARRTALAAVKLALMVSMISGATGAAFFLLFQHGTAGPAALQWLGAVMFALLVTLSAVHRGLGSLIIGIAFDRLVYQIFFVLLLLAVGGFLAANRLALETYAAVLVIAAAGSLGYLFIELGTHISTAFRPHRVLAQARHVLPFFVVNCLFVVNSRYLLSYCGIFLHGEVLGEIGLVFTTIAIMIIPTTTLNLVVAPILAQRLAKPGARRIVLLYLSAVSVLVLGGVALVSIAHPLIFRIAKLGLTISPEFVLLLCGAFGLTLIGNAGLLVEQLRGRAGEAARLFSVTMAAKLIGGYWIADHFGVTALFGLDISLGLIFVIALISQLLRFPETHGRMSAVGAAESQESRA